jgi:hypothetical protein
VVDVGSGEVGRLGINSYPMWCRAESDSFPSFNLSRPTLLVAPDRDNASIRLSTLLVSLFQPDICGEKFTVGFMQGC